MPDMHLSFVALMILVLTSMLGGCVTAEGRMLARIWPNLVPGATAGAESAAPPTPYYCYRNIGGMDCYVKPDPQRLQ